MDLVSFDSLAGAHVSYARQPVAMYGTKGKYPRTVRLDRPFHTQLVACLSELWSVSWGPAEVLVSGGCYVEKSGRHGEGRAIDIDALWWEGRPPVITRNAPHDAVRYLGVEAVLRKHIGTVLGYWYNKDHEDHWHCDNGMPPAYREGSRSQVVFIQAALSYVHLYPVVIDGEVGKKTRTALAMALGEAYPPDIGKTWMSFLDLTIASAFAGT